MYKEALLNLEALGNNPYSGRGIIMGKDPSGTFLIQAYWIMGRSEGSRNRVLRRYDSRVFTEVADKSKEVGDPELTLYNAMQENWSRYKTRLYVVSNGRQTDDAAEGVRDSLLDDLDEYGYERDAPNFTPRITAVWKIITALGDEWKTMEVTAQIAVLKKSLCGETCDRQLFEIGEVAPGYGYCVNTYMGDGNPLPAFRGEPYLLPLTVTGIVELGKWFWDILNPINRVALAMKYIEIATGESTTYIINKYDKV